MFTLVVPIGKIHRWEDRVALWKNLRSFLHTFVNCTSGLRLSTQSNRYVIIMIILVSLTRRYGVYGALDFNLIFTEYGNTTEINIFNVNTPNTEKMSKLHENYYLRKCFIEKNEVPTQSLMKKKMGSALANVYFKSMTPKLKELAGFEPPLRGGGSDWFMPPDDLLTGRAVLKPIHKQYLSKLSCDGIVFFGEKFIDDYRKLMELEKRKLLRENDLKWMSTIREAYKQEDSDAAELKKQNSLKIKQAFDEFTILYRTSITKIESLLIDAGLKEIERFRNEAYKNMTSKFQKLQNQQSSMLHNKYEEIFKTEMNEHKKQFVEEIEKLQIATSDEMHDLNIEKHIAVEKLRTLLECQNLACQVYVALKERTECKKDLEISKRKHEKTIRIISDQINMKDFEIKLAQEKEKKRQEFNSIWRKKVCHVVKKFQEFVKYCLKNMPNHADFFINMEKLMLLQLSEVLENPSAESIFEPEEEHFKTPIPRPHPFFLVCDKGFKPQIDQNLCPKHCTSSASQFPVIVVNKRCIYAACDNFESFTDKVKQFLEGQRGDDLDFIDDHDYTYDVPINCTSSDQLLQLQLESSLMQILQNELPNKQVPTECTVCKSLYCFCTPTHTPEEISDDIVEKNPSPKYYVASGDKITLRKDELTHMRAPTIESYLDYIKPQVCKCAKAAKKHLKEHLPAYMKNVSTFQKLDIPQYEPCSLEELKRLVKKSQNVQPTILPDTPSKKTKDASTQYSDEEYNDMCDCLSDKQNLFRGLDMNREKKEKAKSFSVFDESQSSSYLQRKPSSFVIDTAMTLRHLMKESPELEEIFKKDSCTSDNTYIT